MEFASGSPPVTEVHIPESARERHIVAIGASTGGTEALERLLRGLPTMMPAIVIVQHMPPFFTKLYAERLDRQLALCVTEAAPGEHIRPGHVYIAPGDRHLTVKKLGGEFFVHLAGGERVSGHCPSVDVLFESVARAAGDNATGVILTGMGADGARGLLAMRRCGAYTLGQDEATCVVYGMPQKAMELHAVAQEAPLGTIATLIVGHLLTLAKNGRQPDKGD
jgi:two-component system chemotaxis response regulator CheB